MNRRVRLSPGLRGARPRALIAIAALAGAGVVAAHGIAVIGEFNGPLFGLEFDRSGELLVADASTGIIPVRNGHKGTPISLPGVTAVSSDGPQTIWAVTGAGGIPPNPQADTGQGVHLLTNKGVQKIANLFQYEADANPHPANGVPDSNPYAIHALGSQAALVVDAGGNDLMRVDRWGNIKLLAVFPTEPESSDNIKSLFGCPGSGAGFCFLPPVMDTQAVPTSIAVDHRGYIYVGELKGFPAPAGVSSIWRVSPAANGAICGQSPDCVKIFDGGFTSIIDLAFGPDGLLYVAELDEGSWAAVEILGQPAGGTINACSVRFGFCFEVAEGIEELTAIAFDKKGGLWATRHALIPGEAEVIQVRPGWRRWWWHFAHRFFD